MLLFLLLNTMDNIVRTRIKIINDAIDVQIVSAEEVIQDLIERKISLEKAKITANKLKSLNERFISELHNYFKSVEEEHSEDEVSRYTMKQMKAEELVAEIETRATIPTNPCSVLTSGEDTMRVATRLPRMELARFDGNILKWHQFWDQFSSNVDSRKINDVDKLLYLQSVLEGEAKQAIDGLDTTNKNYRIAVDTLKERYGKGSAIIDAHYVALYRIRTATSSVKECRNVFSEIERHLRVLQSLGEDVNHNHLRVMIMEKFPEDLIYELRLKLGNEDESIFNIRKNLEYIISARETSSRLKKDTSKFNVQEENYTLEALHVRTDNRNGFNRQNNRGYFNNRRNEAEKGRFNKNLQNQYRKRLYDDKKTENYENNLKRKKPHCIFCEGDHFNDACQRVKSIDDRKCKLRGRCYMCFRMGHKAEDCRLKAKCYHCEKYGIHNRAICPDKYNNKHNNATKTFHVNSNNSNSMTVLQTSVVKIYKQKEDSQFFNCRVLLDSGSQRSYIKSKIAKELNLPVLEEHRLSVFTFGSRSPKVIESPVVTFEIVTRTNKRRKIHANVVSHITESVPCPYGNILNDNYGLDKNEILADDGSRNDQVDILLGNDYYHSFMSNQKIKIDTDFFLVNSDFGWVWSGRWYPNDYNEKDNLTILTYFQSNKHFDGLFNEPDIPLRNEKVNQLWDLESIGIVDSPKSSRDEEAVKQFNDTTQFIDNRYYVKWPWVDYPPLSLPVNYGMALGRLTNLIKRLNSRDIETYDTVLKEQLHKGIIEKVKDLSLSNEHPIHYLPHHCVLRDDKSTKLRIVYDASAKTNGNNSLNECLYRGPLMLEELTALIIRFREHKIGIVADVEKAFLQIGLQEEDRDVTRFLWINDINKNVEPENIVQFRFCRVPFGVISSPFLLNATIKHHLNNSNSDIAKRVSEDIYVDNIVTGSNTLNEAVALYDATKKSFDGLSMNIREWNSNCEEFLANLPSNLRDKRKGPIKVLGIEWDTENDTLALKPNRITTQSNYTKRKILQVTASIYDPCGFVAPITLPAKILIQDLWKQKLKWDDKLPQHLCEKWDSIKINMEKIETIKIPRVYTNRNTENLNKLNYELHGFADASIRAYATVIYIRAYDDRGETKSVNFVLGKSRVAPVKDQEDLQIPRLELLAAVIGNRLIQYVNKSIRLHIQKQYLWIDSEIVLSWCKTEKLLPPFVARRINEIKLNKRLILRYVPTTMNPADAATRTVDPLSNTKYWLSGPEFLRKPADKWPRRSNQQDKISSVGEGLSESTDRIHTKKKQRSKTANVLTYQITEKNDNIDTAKEEEIREMDVRIGQSTDTSVARNETKEQDESATIINLQKQHFSNEYKGIETDLVRSLKLFKDNEGLLRCKGRFDYTDWTEDKKHPILLPKNTDFTTKIIETIHKNNFHVGVSHTLSLTRNKYWILQGRAQVQKVLKNCLQCRKYGGGPYKLPLMPPLPVERINYSKPFTFTGIDYFGPLKVNEGELVEKRWVCLFTCLAVRAIHMEIIKDLTAEECVMAIRRFVSTRGLPQVITSDNASQFKLTAEVLTSQFCIRNEISWRFIPQLAPWFGGFYERLIGIVKNCLKRTIDKHLMTNNQLCTIIKEIEAVINTRPLTTVGAEFEQVLCPADFLRIGGPLMTEISDEEFLENSTTTKNTLIETWKRGQSILREFIKMFESHYLTSLRERRSLHKQSRVVVNRVPAVGDIVQIKSDQNRSLWKVGGRISEVLKGSDGHIRVAKVITSSGEILTRSIGHLYPLEFTEKDSNRQNESTEQTEIIEGAEQHTTREEQVPSNEGAETRTQRASAQRAMENIKQWTRQLFNNIM